MTTRGVQHIISDILKIQYNYIGIPTVRTRYFIVWILNLENLEIRNYF